MEENMYRVMLVAPFLLIADHAVPLPVPPPFPPPYHVTIQNPEPSRDADFRLKPDDGDEWTSGNLPRGGGIGTWKCDSCKSVTIEMTGQATQRQLKAGQIYNLKLVNGSFDISP
jgi:hypothetical protein